MAHYYTYIKRVDINIGTTMSNVIKVAWKVQEDWLPFLTVTHKKLSGFNRRKLINTVTAKRIIKLREQCEALR